MSISCGTCRKLIIGKSHKLSGEDAKEWCGWSVTHLCNDCFGEFKLYRKMEEMYE